MKRGTEMPCVRIESKGKAAQTPSSILSFNPSLSLLLNLLVRQVAAAQQPPTTFNSPHHHHLIFSSSNIIYATSWDWPVSPHLISPVGSDMIWYDGSSLNPQSLAVKNPRTVSRLHLQQISADRVRQYNFACICIYVSVKRQNFKDRTTEKNQKPSWSQN